MTKSQYKCPICDCPKCEELIIDLLICDNCSHIFKTVPFSEEGEVIAVEEIHKQVYPITSTRLYLEQNKNISKMTFEFPSLMFHIMDLKPNDFYRHKFNHYFNQMSLMIFLKRCGLIPVKQETNKVVRTSHTKIEVEVEK